MELVQSLKVAELFAGLSEQEFERLRPISKLREYREGDEIFHESEAGDDLCVLVEGRVRLDVALGRADDATVHTAKAGDVFGEFAVLDNQPRSATAIAVKSSKVIRISKEDLFALFDAHPRIGFVVMRNMARTLCARIRKTTSELRVSLLWGAS